MSDTDIWCLLMSGDMHYQDELTCVLENIICIIHSSMAVIWLFLVVTLTFSICENNIRYVTFSRCSSSFDLCSCDDAMCSIECAATYSHPRMSTGSLIDHFHRAMHYSTKRGIEIACRLSVRPSVCPSVTLEDQDHTSWKSYKLIA